MKKLLLGLFVAVLSVAGCHAPAKKEVKTIKVASHTAPMVDMLKLVEDDLKNEGFMLEVVKVSDNVQANTALKNKEVDANFFQHKAFMELFNKGNNANLIAIQPVYDAIVSFYSKKYKNISELEEKATVAIPSDPSNMARALRLLASHNIITLNDPQSYIQTLETIKDNPKQLQFTPISLLNLNEAYNEKDLVFNYPAYAAKINLTPSANGLLLEDGKDKTFAISIVAREDNKNSDEVKALQKVFTSEKVKKFVEEKLKGHARVAF